MPQDLLTCENFTQGRCKSCTWIETPYSAQILQKEKVIQSTLEFMGPFQLEASQVSVLKGFRNRAKMSVTGSVDAPIIGLIGEELMDQGRELLDCPIHHPRLNQLFQALPAYIRDYHLIPYQIESRKGELKGLIAFYSPTSQQMYLRFILRSKECVSRIQKLLPRLQLEFPDLICVSANLQPIPHAILEGTEEIILSEQKHIQHRLGAIDLHLTPQAFVQTHVEGAIELYATAAAWIEASRAEKMLELFCGQGAFSFFAGKKSTALKKILGIEVNADAVQIAEQTAQALHLPHVKFAQANAQTACGETLNQLIDNFSPDLILANPPRKGLKDGVELIIASLPQSFIYSSCSIETLAIDLKKISTHYRIERIKMFDLFPHTAHFETLVFLTKI